MAFGVCVCVRGPWCTRVGLCIYTAAAAELHRLSIAPAITANVSQIALCLSSSALAAWRQRRRQWQSRDPTFVYFEFFCLRKDCAHTRYYERYRGYSGHADADSITAENHENAPLKTKNPKLIALVERLFGENIENAENVNIFCIDTMYERVWFQSKISLTVCTDCCQLTKST